MNRQNHLVSDPEETRKILVIRYRFLGDTILTVPFLRNLKRAYPRARIDMVVGPVSGEVLQGCPYVDKFIEYDTTRFHKYDSGTGKKRSLVSYLADFRDERYDLVFVLKRSWTSALIAMATGAKYRVGYATEGRSILLSHPVKFDPSIHEVDSLLSVARAAGIEIADDYLEAWISKEEKENIFSKVPALKEKTTRVLIHAAAAHPDKLYPLELWTDLIQKLATKSSLTLFFTGAAQDRPVYEELSQASQVKSVNMAGELNIRESMALYSEMDLAICVDSGPAHLAAATGVPTYTLFGPTDPERWAPRGNNCKAVFDNSLSCRPCHYRKTCQNRECLTELDPDYIIESMAAMA